MKLTPQRSSPPLRPPPARLPKHGNHKKTPFCLSRHPPLFARGEPARPSGRTAPDAKIDDAPSRPPRERQPESPAADPGEPLARALAFVPCQRPESPQLTTHLPPAVACRVPDEVALDGLVRRFAWGGNGRRGTARIELGAGALAGLTLLLSAEDGNVSLEVEGDPTGEQTRRITERLRARGIRITAAG